MAKANTSFFRNFVDELKDEDMHMASDQSSAAEFDGFFDTGSYMLNALVSGSLYGGIPNNKVTAFAGESTTGKTFFCIGVIKTFLDANPNGGILYYDSEAAVTSNMLKIRGVDPQRVIVGEPDSIQDFKIKCVRAIKKYVETPENKRPPMMFVLDSLGALPSIKESGDALEGKIVQDMTPAKAVRSAFRVIRLGLARAKIPLLCTQHTYDNTSGYGEMKKISGGGGLIYASDEILVLSKAKDVDNKKRVQGIIITVKVHKSRISRENSVAKIRLNYTTGLDRWYGLLEFGLEHELFVRGKKGTQIAWSYGNDGDMILERQIYKNPTEFFTKEVMAALEKVVQNNFLYGDGEHLLGTNNTKESSI